MSITKCLPISKHSYNMSRNKMSVRQALESAQSSENETLDTETSTILTEELDRIWTRIQTQPTNYIMDRTEFGIFNRYRSDTRFQNETARTAIARYWNSINVSNGRHWAWSFKYREGWNREQSGCPAKDHLAGRKKSHLSTLPMVFAFGDAQICKRHQKWHGGHSESMAWAEASRWTLINKSRRRNEYEGSLDRLGGLFWLILALTSFRKHVSGRIDCADHQPSLNALNGTYFSLWMILCIVNSKSSVLLDSTWDDG